MSIDWIDISAPIRADMVVWPGDPAVGVTQTDEGMYRLTRLNMSAHTGTHMDAPMHFIPGGVGMDAMPLSAVLGPCVVVGIDDSVCVRPEHLESLALEPGGRLLLKTSNSRLPLDAGRFDEGFVYISAAAAQWMVEHKVRTVGIDYLSVGGFTKDTKETHDILLGAGIWIVEGLRLGHVEPGPYELACLPLLIPGSDGAPARAVLRRLT